MTVTENSIESLNAEIIRRGLIIQELQSLMAAARAQIKDASAEQHAFRLVSEERLTTIVNAEEEMTRLREELSARLHLIEQLHETTASAHAQIAELSAEREALQLASEERLKLVQSAEEEMTRLREELAARLLLIEQLHRTCESLRETQSI